MLESLLAQAVGRVRLTLPRRFDDVANERALPALPGGVDLFRTEADHGPATKWLPVLQEAEGPVLICDDDWLYAPGWAEGFLAAASAHPGAAIAASTFDAARLGVGPGMVVQGFAGVLLTRSMLPDAAFDMPALARHVDDIWLSGMLALAGTKVVTAPHLRRLCTPSGNEVQPLQTRTDRARLNRDCAAHLQETYGIW